jgi:enoyl-CoA hydratase/carnithine racemase
LVDGVLRVTIKREEKRNALSLGVLERVREIFTEAATRADLRLAILTGAGDKAFASGGDLVELADKKTVEAARALSLHGKAALNAVRRLPVPVVARVNGVALGGGAEFALACDMRFAAAHAAIGFIHSKLGISPSWGGSADLMRLVGSAAATQMLTRAEILKAPEALALGLFNGAAVDEDFDAAFDGFVAPMLKQPPQVMRAIKAAALIERLRGLGEAHDVETGHFAITWTHDDHWAAADAMQAQRAQK